MSRRRELSAAERSKAQAAMAQLDSAPSRGLHQLLHFADGDPGACVPLVKQTQVVQRLCDVVDRSRIPADVACAVEVLAALAFHSQSAAVAAPFTRAPRLPRLVDLLDDDASLPHAAALLEQVFSGMEGNTARASAWAAGIPTAMLAKVASRAGGTEQALVDVCRVLNVLCVLQKRRIAEELPAAVPTLCSALACTLRQRQWSATGELLHVLTACVAGIEANAKAVINSANRDVTEAVLRLCSPGAPQHCASAALVLLFTVFDTAPETEAVLRSCFADSGSQPQESFLWAPLVAPFRAFVTFVPEALAVIRRDHLKPDAVAATLTKLQEHIAEAPPPLAELYRFALGESFTAVKTLLLPLSSVDEDVTAKTCALLSFALDRNAPAVRMFVALGGVDILLDVLDDYSEAVLRAAFDFLASIACVPTAMREIVDRGVFARVVHVLRRSVIEKISAGPCGEEVRPALAALCPAAFGFIAATARAPPEALSTLLPQHTHALLDVLHTAVTELPPVFALFAWNAAAAMVSTVHGPESVEKAKALTVAAEASAASVVSASSAALPEELRGPAVLELFGFIAAAAKVSPEIQTTVVAAGKAIPLAVQVVGLSSANGSAAPGNVGSASPAAWLLLAALTSHCEAGQVAVASDTVAVRHLVSLLPAPRLDGAGPHDGLCDELYSVLQVQSHIWATLPATMRTQPWMPDHCSLVSATARLTSHPNVTTAVRLAAIDALQSLLDRGSDVSVAQHMLHVLLECEGSDEESTRMLANRCFKLLLMTPSASAAALLAIAGDALALLQGASDNAPYRSPTKNGKWPWAPLDAPEDEDDAHDLLLGLVPLFNGMLHHDQGCCDAVVAAGSAAWALFLELLTTPRLEFGLRTVVVFAVANVLNHVRSSRDVLPLLSQAPRFIAALADLRCLAALTLGHSAAQQPCLAAGGIPLVSHDGALVAQALSAATVPDRSVIVDTCDTLYFLCERLLLLCRSAKVPHGTIPDAAAFKDTDGSGVAAATALVAFTAYDACRVESARSLLMSWLEDDTGDVALLSEARQAIPLLAEGTAAAVDGPTLRSILCSVLTALSTDQSVSNDTRVIASARLRWFA